MTLVYARWELSLRSSIRRAQGSCSDHLCGDLKHRVAQLPHDGGEAAHSHRAEPPRQRAHCIGRCEARPHLEGWHSMLTIFTPSNLVAIHGWLSSRHLCQKPLNGGKAYPVRVHTWLSS